MNALESRIDIGLDDGRGKRSNREKDIDEDMESVFRTKVRWDHVIGPQKKISKVYEELQEATFYHALE